MRVDGDEMRLRGACRGANPALVVLGRLLGLWQRRAQLSGGHKRCHKADSVAPRNIAEELGDGVLVFLVASPLLALGYEDVSFPDAQEDVTLICCNFWRA